MKRDTWVELAAVDNFSRTPTFFVLQDKLRFAIEYLPHLVDLLEQLPPELKNEATKKETIYADKDYVSLILVEPNGQMSSPDRIVTAIESLQSIYGVLAILGHEKPEDLAILTCDSGSEQSFDFLGATKIIGMVKEVIITLWEKIAFYRDIQMDKRLDMVINSLPIIGAITEMEKKKSIGPELAELMRRNISAGLHKFVEAGVIIPELEQRTYFDPKIVLAPSPKLLMASIEMKEDSNSENLIEEEKDTEELDSQSILESHGELSPNEIARIRRIIENQTSLSSDASENPPIS
jgi:hypothetical protein